MENLVKINSGINGADDTDLICVTASAINAIKITIDENNVPGDYFVRINADSGGCSGLTYSIEFDYNFSNTDRIIEAEGLRFVFDSKTIFYALGITLDYVDSVEEGIGFVFRGYRDYKSCACIAN